MEALGSFSFGCVFFVDTKKMNPSGGPEPVGSGFSRMVGRNKTQGLYFARQFTLLSHHKK
jgi:hypothetical protein